MQILKQKISGITSTVSIHILLLNTKLSYRIEAAHSVHIHSRGDFGTL